MFGNFLAPKGKFEGPHTTCADELSVSFDAKILCPLPVIVYYCALAEGASLLQLYLIRGLGTIKEYILFCTLRKLIVYVCMHMCMIYVYDVGRRY